MRYLQFNSSTLLGPIPTPRGLWRKQEKMERAVCKVVSGDRRRGGNTTSNSKSKSGQGWSSPTPRGLWRKQEKMERAVCKVVSGDRRRGGNTTSNSKSKSGQGWSSPTPRGLWRKQEKMERAGCKVLSGAPKIHVIRGSEVKKHGLLHRAILLKKNRKHNHKKTS